MMFLAACSGGGDSTIDITHDPCSGVTLRAAGASESQTAGIDAAIGLWAGRGIALSRVADHPTIEIVFEYASYAFRGVYDDERGVIIINEQIVEPALSIVIAHELGHAFGLPHVTGRTSVMNPANLETPPNDDDAGALAEIWGPCDDQAGKP
jgi:predicted Zn-dependent protease